MTPYELARAEIGTVEWNNGSNPKVLAYYADAGHSWVKDDSVAWCAAFVGAMLKRAGMKGTGELTARSYLGWGEFVSIEDAKPGDIVVFKRGNSTWQGHVAFYVSCDAKVVKVLGGNQSDQVKESDYLRSSLLSVRRMPGLQAVTPASSPTPSRSLMGWIMYLLTGGKA